MTETPRPLRRLSRESGGVWLGTCAGLGRHLGCDPILVRLALVFAAAVLPSAGPGLLAAYLLTAMVVPRE